MLPARPRRRDADQTHLWNGAAPLAARHAHNQPRQPAGLGGAQLCAGRRRSLGGAPAVWWPRPAAPAVTAAQPVQAGGWVPLWPGACSASQPRPCCVLWRRAAESAGLWLLHHPGSARPQHSSPSLWCGRRGWGPCGVGDGSSGGGHRSGQHDSYLNPATLNASWRTTVMLTLIRWDSSKRVCLSMVRLLIVHCNHNNCSRPNEAFRKGNNVTPLCHARLEWCQ